ncbi:hypothetical protein [Legionella fallonii]|uniref:Uncharacterized protein n=1 Tax=Legionella fallonii LLAP-10 TaxID=1212491 RepID=A0A098G579_9GAMM|nr:hypothetical protein [Legionella fallonii]CEG57121.1 conserved protein of unknown function [Legionella fallonii LLAP-10]
MSNGTAPKLTMTSDMVHNHNCHAYLLQLKPFINQHILDLNQSFLDQITQLDEEYNEGFPYGNLYSNAISALEDQLDLLYACANAEQTEALDDLVFIIYHNNSRILEQTEWINQIGSQTRPIQVDTSKRIEHELEDNDQLINKISPNTTSQVFNRIGSVFSANFKPQLATNLPSLKNYSYRENVNPTEYRFGTQAQRHEGAVRISPLFKRWLLINARQCSPSQSIAYIYFNNLGLDRSHFDIAGSKERNLSLTLHELEHDSSLKIAVITLPAYQSLMDESHYNKTEDHLSYTAVFKELIEVAEGKGHESDIADFWISKEIRKQLFGNDKEQFIIFSKLLTNSFKEYGVNPSDTLSTAQKQAIWLHFTKFELTNYIINTLNPRGYNFSCKDAIDRGALSSAYYNLMNSFKLQQPIQREEFERALDAAAAHVKGRGMNFHRNIIWNALDSYVNANYETLITDDKKSWLIFWRDMNCPHSRVPQLLEIRINQLQMQLDSLSPQNLALQKTGNKLLKAIKEQHEAQINGQRLLLELVARTSQLLTIHSPSQATIQAYENLAEELQLNHPMLHIIAGIAKVFLGILLFLPSFGYSKSLINSGISTYKTGFFASQRAQLNEDIIEFSSTYICTPVA